MKIRFDLTVRFADHAGADKLRRVLLPDNKGLPRDQKFKAVLDESALKVVILSPRLMPGLSTLDSVLLDVDLFNEISSSST